MVKSTPGVNFTNVLQATFTNADPKSAQKDSQVKQLFCAFGISAHVKAACRMLVKLTPGLSHPVTWSCI